ncbi:MAG: radical SAM protein [Elusimicrobiota bacterium]
MSWPEKSKNIKKYVEDKFGRLGLNKKNEIARLAYEISKREKNNFENILPDTGKSNNYHFEKIKNNLLNKRFPEYAKDMPKEKVYLPKLEIGEENRAGINNQNTIITPKKVYYEEGTENSGVLQNLIKKFPGVETRQISEIKEFITGSDYSIENYNKRRETVIVTKQRYDFIKPCPCTKRCLCCGYHIFNLGFGCPYECTYCYLQEYTNTPGIILPANLDDYFKKFRNYVVRKSKLRMGTGEFTDSLVFDDITGYSKEIVKFMRDFPEIIFEFKTKSTNIDNLLNIEPPENVVISWSLNPQNFIDENEHFTPSLDSRLEAASKCVERGYRVGFHFDPVVPYTGWKKEYGGVIDKMYSRISKDKIAWISLGTFRFSRNLKRIIENRFPDSDILNGELFIGFDGKLRYPQDLRIEVYREMLKKLKPVAGNPYIYLCMENKKVWEACGLDPEWRWS